MPWYAIISYGEDGEPIKREILFRDSHLKVRDFIDGRIRSNRLSDEVWGWLIAPATAEETWDWDIDEPMPPSQHALEVPIEVGKEQFGTPLGEE